MSLFHPNSIGAAGLLAAALVSLPAAAVTIEVGGGCTLESAILAANTNEAQGGCTAGTVGSDTLVLERHSVHQLTQAYSTPHGASGTPAITEDLVIDGRQSIIKRAEGAPDFRLLTLIDADDRPSLNLILSFLTLSGGQSEEGGGALYVKLNGNGSLTMYNCTLSDNHSAGNGGALMMEGIPGNGTLLINASTISNNSADGQSTQNGGQSASGGGLYTQHIGNVYIGHSTISGNQAATNAGGGIFYKGDSGPQTLHLSNSTVTGNLAKLTGGVVVQDTNLVISRSIISGNLDTLGGAGNSGAQEMFVLRGAVSGQGYNLIGVDNDAGVANILNLLNSFTPGPTDTVPQESLSAILAPLANNSGYLNAAPTHALVAASPALDAALDCGDGNERDQRYIERPRGAACDIGAFERGGPTLLDAQAVVLVPGFKLSLNPTATLTDAKTGELLVGQTVRFGTGKNSLCNAVTNANGIATCSASAQVWWLGVLLNQGYWAEFDGTDTFDASTGQGPALKL